MHKDGKTIGNAGLMLDSEFHCKRYAYHAFSINIDPGLRILGLDEIHVACVDANVALKGLVNVKFGFRPALVQDKLFGTEWICKITREQWRRSAHSTEGRARTSLRG